MDKFWKEITTPCWPVSVAVCSLFFNVLASYVKDWIDKAFSRLSNF